MAYMQQKAFSQPEMKKDSTSLSVQWVATGRMVLWNGQ
jgi:hypothetical protein